MPDMPVSIFQGDLPIAAKLDRARTELLDLSARNRLLNVPRFSKAAKTVEVLDEVSTEVFRMLEREGKVFTFLPGRTGTEPQGGKAGDGDAEEDAEELAELPQPEDDTVDERGTAPRHADTRLQTRMTSTGLQNRLLDLHVDARTLEEEQGVNTLYLALGLLRWTDPLNAANVRHAPLVLLPVRLERGAAGERFRLRMRPDEWSSNLSLEAYLERVHSLRLPALDPGEEFDAATYFDGVADAVSSKKDWAVLRDDIVLGLFSFAKFLMYRDLDPANWPGHATLVDHPTVRALVSEGFPPEPGALPEDAAVDDHIPPRDMLHIVDCDSSQAMAVHDARAGRSLVIQGPPGTGKSQTIANVIASAVADGRTVLFVAEKMAALDVVKRRLDHAGVGDACLELHSSKANKRLVLEELKRTWALGSPRGDFPDGAVRRLTEARDALNAHAARMHQPHVVAGLTPYQLIGGLDRLRQDGRKPSDVVLVAPERWSDDDRSLREETVRELAGRVADIGLPSQHPWRNVGLTVVIPTEVQRLTDRIGRLAAALDTWTSALRAVAGSLEVEPPARASEVPPTLALARRVASAPGLDAAALADPAWTEFPGQLSSLLAICRSAQDLAGSLEDKLLPGGIDADVASIIPELHWLPPAFGEDAFSRVNAIARALPRLLVAVRTLEAELGAAPAPLTLASASRMATTGERVAAAPDASPEAFAATVWEHGVEQAGELAEAVAVLEAVRQEFSGEFTEAAWSTDVAGARQALATHTGILRRFNAEWRLAGAVVRSVLRRPDAPLQEQLSRLDALMRGQAARTAVLDGDAFGRSAFGADWRGERSASAPLAALVAWMRTLRGLGAEPRLIAGRLPERSALAGRAAIVRKLIDEVAAPASGSWLDLDEAAPAALGDAAGPERVDLEILAARVAALADADARCRQIIAGAPDLPGRLEILGLVQERQEAVRRVEAGATLGGAAFGGAWRGVDSGLDVLSEAAAWLAANPDVRHLASRIPDRPALTANAEAIEAAGDVVIRSAEGLFQSLGTGCRSLFGDAELAAVPFGALADRLALWLRTPEQLSKWVAYKDRAERARGLGLAALVDRVEDGRIAPADAADEFSMAYLEALLSDMVRADPALGRFDGALHDGLTRDFASLDRQRIKAAALETVRAHHRRIPPPGGGIGPVGVLRAEMARRRGHMPIRQLVQKAAGAVQALKPVLMMSPLSVAQFLTPGSMMFDLLVMDEASQIQPVDALGAIARCRQVVVVGDERQLPPTRFFARTTGGQGGDEEDGAQVADIESILGLFTARGLPQRMLRWHYRSRHQSLIAVSNSQFYESKLFIVPSPYTSEAGMGLSFHHVPDGVFDAGGSAGNPVEARVVAEAVIRHARAAPGLSLGVATFSAVQRKVVQDEVERLRRLNPDTEEFFRAHPSEPFFIKNLENVQGDERDVVIISVGYGKSANAPMSMRFGPLGADGGERRLNVLISRAKLRCEVYASFTDEDIDLTRARGRGVVAFKLFLHYARTGRLSAAPEIAARGHESLFDEQVARALQALGYQVHPRVGIAGFFIDLAIADPARPGRYLLGVECDGPSYRGLRSARDRDRLRREVLEDHGWTLHRIWSADWLQRPEEQLRRTVAAIEAAKVELETRSETGGAAGRAVQVEVVTVEREDVDEVGLEAARGPAAGRAYVEAVPAVPRATEMHETPAGAMAELVAGVVAVEGPVHLDEVVVRLRTAWGLQRSGGRIQAAVARGAAIAGQRGQVAAHGAFLSVPGKAVRARDRGDVASPTLRRPEMLPPSELDAAVLETVQASLGAAPEEAVMSAARLLGVRAVSAQMRALLQARVDALAASGALAFEAGLLTTRVEGRTGRG